MFVNVDIHIYILLSKIFFKFFVNIMSEKVKK